MVINFISTFPPIICGIGSYTKSLVEHLPEESWRILSPRMSHYACDGEAVHGNVSFTIDLDNPCLPDSLDNQVLWFQHAFGMWGDPSIPFVKLIREAKQKHNTVIATLQALHFQSVETEWGFDKREHQLLQQVLPHIDALPVLSKGTYDAAAAAFPEFKDKITLVRHGIHIYPQISQSEAKHQFLGYLLNHPDISAIQKEEIKYLRDAFEAPNTVLLGNFGFLTPERDPLALYRLSQMLQQKLPGHKIIAVYCGIVQKRADRPDLQNSPLVDALNSMHDKKNNLFFNVYLPDDVFPHAFSAMDYTVIWYRKATQSGRMAHAQGTGSCVVGRDIEGVGETLKLAGLPFANTLQDLAIKVRQLVLNPGVKEQAQANNLRFAHRFSFKKQALKHYTLACQVHLQQEVPAMDLLEPTVANDMGSSPDWV